MLFNSYVFVFLFFPLCLGGFYGLRKRGSIIAVKAVLTLLSLWFYAFLNPLNLPALLVSMAGNYGIYRLMKRRTADGGGRPVLILGIALNLLALFVFKYTGSAFAPLGISFFTFSQIAFLVQGYKGNLKKTGFADYAFYVTFFPKLIQGPIALPEEMEGQVETAAERPFDWECFYRGLNLFLFGLAKKVLLADTLGRAVDQGYNSLNALNSADALIVTVSYTLQLYFDFSGYCDMASGAAQMLGFSLPLNFHSPYKAGNIIEFWKGWHITLTRFFTRYLYIPLGGSRRGRWRTYRNILIVFFVSGIWHGAGPSFLVWGMLHGILYVLTRYRMDVRKRHMERDAGRKTGCSEDPDRIPGAGGLLLKKGRRLLSVVGTFLYVNAAWVFFRSPSLGVAVSLLRKILSFRFGRLNWELAGCFNLDEFWYVIKVLRIDRWQYAHYILMVLILAGLLWLVFFGRTAQECAQRVKPKLFHTGAMAVLFLWCIVTFSNVTSFIYFNF